MLNTHGSPVVEARAVSVAIAGRPVLRSNDLTVHEGEFVALMGANGSGKSTLVRGMLGLAQVLGGEVELFGQPVSRLRERWRVGYVPQDMLIMDATIAEI